VVNEVWSGFYDFDDFAAFVFAAMRASPVRADFLVAVRALRKLRNA